MLYQRLKKSEREALNEFSKKENLDLSILTYWKENDNILPFDLAYSLNFPKFIIYVTIPQSKFETTFSHISIYWTTERSTLAKLEHILATFIVPKLGMFAEREEDCNCEIEEEEEEEEETKQETEQEQKQESENALVYSFDGESSEFNKNIPQAKTICIL